MGETLAERYRVDAQIGRGSHGAVYRATQLATGREVALKILRRDRLDDGVAIRRFEREARLTCRLEHPNSISMLDYGTHQGLCFMVMELLRGEPLRQRLARGPLPAAGALRVATQIAKSLNDAHSQGIVHRDLKPDNVFLCEVVGESDFVKVLDFGIAKLADAPEATITASEVIVGTPRYLSPEQARGDEVDARADQYALGCVLYHMLAGRPPFTDAKTVALLFKHAGTPPERLDRLVDVELPEPLVDLVHRLLAKEPAERFATTGELVEALETLEPLCRGIPAASAPPLAPETLDALPATESRAGLDAPRGLKRSPRLAWLAAAALVVAIGATLALVSGDSSSAPLPSTVEGSALRALELPDSVELKPAPPAPVVAAPTHVREAPEPAKPAKKPKKRKPARTTFETWD